jgi:hypothetical protein
MQTTRHLIIELALCTIFLFEPYYFVFTWAIIIMQKWLVIWNNRCSSSLV